MWVLLLIAYSGNSGVSIATPTFNTEARCLEALANAVAIEKFDQQVKGRCVKQ
jgi:hypothetical protein